MDKEKKYAAFAIPRHELRPREGAIEQTRPEDALSLHDAPFAEVEYEPFVRSVSSPAPSQPILPPKSDPIRERFYAMRSLASGIPFARNDPALFYRQAKFMEDFTDNFPGSATFFQYYPCYQHMGYEQLRTYFTWRTKLRRGAFEPISLSYIFLYLYELLSGIGAEDPADGLDQLLAVWSAYREREPALDKHLPGWLKDYHIYYPLPHSFADFVREHDLYGHYPELFLFDNGCPGSFALWSSLSSYDITKSKFYIAGNDALMRDCFSAVLNGIQALFLKHNRRIEDILTSGVTRGAIWYPFGQALFHNWLNQPDRQVELPGGEQYLLINNRWRANLPTPDPDRREIIGYLMKKTEECLRKAVNFKFQLKANPSAFCNLGYKLRRLQMTQAELDAAIEKAVTDFHRNLTRTVVAVDPERLNRIRRDALQTQEKLIVPEENVPDVWEAEQPAPQSEPAQVVDGWSALKVALSEVERLALSRILRGAEIRTFADEVGIMLEVLADGINEKAADCIGDSILEFTDSMELYEEYRDKIAEMVG